jgi:3-hydroxymyristoyl/3-hydroxydecanoyl-(acyl carrier protein) dehydratase
MVPGVILLDWALREVGAVISRTGGGKLHLRESKFFDPLLPGQLAELAVAIGDDRCTFRIRRDEVVLAMGVLERRHD